MKTFDELWLELDRKIAAQDVASNSVALINAGVHEIGKKILEEAGEVWLAAEYQGQKELALELSQLLYYIQVLAKARNISVEDIYREI